MSGKLLDAAAVEALMTEAFTTLEKRISRCKTLRDGHMEEKWWARWDEVGTLRKALRALPDASGDRTCATCAWAKTGLSPDGDEALECTNRPFQLDLTMLGRVRIWVNPDHYCAAWREVQK